MVGSIGIVQGQLGQSPTKATNIINNFNYFKQFQFGIDANDSFKCESGFDQD